MALTRAKNSLKLYRNIRSLHTQYTDAKQHEQLYFLNNLPLTAGEDRDQRSGKKDFPAPFKPTLGEADFPTSISDNGLPPEVPCNNIIDSGLWQRYSF